MAVNNKQNSTHRLIEYKKKQKNKRIVFVPLGIRSYFQGQKHKVCRIHLYFAEQVRMCKLLCNWPKKQNIKMLTSLQLPIPIPSNSES